MQAVAIVTAIAAALLFGVSAVMDQRSTKRVKTERALSPNILRDLVRQPLWLMAVGANVAAFALQVVALSFGSLAVVQPLLVFDLVFAVLIGRAVGWDPSNFPPGTKRWDPGLFGGVAAAALGVGGFLAIGRPSAGHTDIRFAALVPLAIGLVVVVGGCLAVAAKNENLRPLALALATGVNYGVAAFSVKLVTSEWGGGLGHVFTNWPFYMLAVTGPAGFILNQDAFQQGTFLAPVQAIITTADPIISIGLSIVWLDARLRSGPAATAGVVISLLVMTIGIVITARHAPQVTAERAPPEPADGQSAESAGGQPADGRVTRPSDVSSPKRP